MSEFPILPDFARKAGHLISGLFLVYFWFISGYNHAFARVPTTKWWWRFSLTW